MEVFAGIDFYVKMTTKIGNKHLAYVFLYSSKWRRQGMTWKIFTKDFPQVLQTRFPWGEAFLACYIILILRTKTFSLDRTRVKCKELHNKINPTHLYLSVNNILLHSSNHLRVLLSNNGDEFSLFPPLELWDTRSGSSHSTLPLWAAAAGGTEWGGGGEQFHKPPAFGSDEGQGTNSHCVAGPARVLILLVKAH